MQKKAALYACGHFLVDFACAWRMLQTMPAPEWFLVYNFCAFALQMPVGLLADLMGRCRAFALWGGAMVLSACLPIPVPLRVVLLGLGNACYHVGGGRDALLADRKFTGLGIFVAPGAMGIFLGGMLAGNRIALGVCLTLLCLCMGLLTCTGKDFSSAVRGRVHYGMLGWMFFVVLVRSFIGMCMETPWKTGAFVAVSALCCALGKALGGIGADRVGWKRAGIASLLLSAGLYCLPGIGIAGCAAALLFQMTMPITLRQAAKDLPGMEGFAFGILTFALFLGYLPAYYGLRISPYVGAGLAILSAAGIGVCREAEA